MLPKLLGYIPAGMSYNTLRHYQQILKSKGIVRQNKQSSSIFYLKSIK